MTDSITREVNIGAPLARVWRAVADSAEFATWFHAVLDGPFESGRTVRGHMTYPGYEGLPIVMRITALRPETYLAFEWPAFVPEEGVLEDEPWTKVEFQLEPQGDATRVRVTESGFDRLPERVRDRVRRENAGGWEEQLRNLAAHVA